MTATQSARWTSSKRRPASPEFFIKTSEAERTAFCLVLLRSFWRSDFDLPVYFGGVTKDEILPTIFDTQA